MTVIDIDIVKTINSGNSFALIGAGPSIEIGIPSWSELSTEAIGLLEHDPSHSSAIEKCKTLIAKSKYPRVFSILSQKVGPEKLLAFVESKVSIKKVDGQLYQFLCNWPFSSYLTTNYDDALISALYSAKIPIVKRLNTKKDMRQLRWNTKDAVFKIHGETSHQDDIVLTEEQYYNFQNGLDRKYWREKLKSIFHMSDLVIIGYSLSDPDLKYLFEQARDVASPDHPIFMFAAGFSEEEINKYFLEYNIRIITYENPDGSHRNLLKLLKRYDPFIAKRGSSEIGEIEVDTKEAELAASIYLFTSLRPSEESQSAIENAYAATILSVLDESQENQLSIDDLRNSLSKKMFAHSHIDPVLLKNALEQLAERVFISANKELTYFALERAGIEAIESTRAERESIIELFEIACTQFLENEAQNLTKKERAIVIKGLERGLTKAFQKRGLEIARSILGDGRVDTSNALDLLSVINLGSSNLENRNLSIAHADLMMKVILSPNSAMKRYLALLSQGYFAYHALGFDPKFSNERLELAKSKFWLLDASVIIPILAVGCANHEYAKDLISRLHSLGIELRTTKMLFEEVRDHAYWALSNFKNEPPSSPQFLLASMGKAGFRSNLFVDGYVNWSSKSGNPSFGSYLKEILGTNQLNALNDAVLEALKNINIDVIDLDETPNFDRSLLVDRDTLLTSKIQEIRERIGTFRTVAQCKAEAEIVLISNSTDTVFISLSTVLNRLFDSKRSNTWKPEAIYRLLALYTKIQPDEDLLFSCMMEDFFSVGITIVDSDALAKFASPLIRQSRMKFDAERDAFEEAFGPDRFSELVERFEATPDEYKPFYSLQFAFYAATQERDKRLEAEARSRQTVKGKSLAEAERLHYERLKGKVAERERKRIKKKRRKKSMPKRRK